MLLSSPLKKHMFVDAEDEVFTLDEDIKNIEIIYIKKIPILKYTPEKLKPVKTIPCQPNKIIFGFNLKNETS